MQFSKPNLAQIEFFHVGASDSLEGMLDECCERIADDLLLARAGSQRRSSSKTVVRLYDERGRLTALALKATRLHERSRKVLEEYGFASRFRRFFYDWESKKLARRAISLRAKILGAAKRELAATVQEVSVVGVELADNSFRALTPEEAHELLESAQRALTAWLFVFEPNDLLADKNELIASFVG